MKKRIILLTGILFVLSLIAVPQAITAQTAPPESEVRPDVGPPGATFAFFATGFQSGEDTDDDGEDEEKEFVSVWINRPDGTATTDGIINKSDVTATGRVDWQWTAPEDAQQGTWSAVALGNTSGREAVILFEVRTGAPEPADDPERLDTNVTPNAGPAGTTFEFFATGYNEGEELSVWVNTPGGTALDISDSVENLREAASGGRADWQWTAPADAQPGMWSMVAQGQESGTERVIPFEITP